MTEGKICPRIAAMWQVPEQDADLWDCGVNPLTEGSTDSKYGREFAALGPMLRSRFGDAWFSIAEAAPVIDRSTSAARDTLKKFSRAGWHADELLPYKLEERATDITKQEPPERGWPVLAFRYAYRITLD